MAENHSLLGDLVSSAIRVLLRVAFVFEPLAPTAITVLIRQQLNRFKEGGIIDDYEAHTKRLGKYHYRIYLDIDLTNTQTVNLLANMFPKQLSRFRRWFYD